MTGSVDLLKLTMTDSKGRDFYINFGGSTLTLNGLTFDLDDIRTSDFESQDFKVTRLYEESLYFQEGRLFSSVQ